MPRDASQAAPNPPAVHGDPSLPEDIFYRYEVNLFVDNGHLTGSPVIVEDHPTYFNLMELRVNDRGPFVAGRIVDLSLYAAKELGVHAVWLTEEDRTILARTGTTVCLCPRSNRRIGVGLADAPALVAAGVPLCLGTDSLASNDDLNLWNEVRALWADHPDFPPAAVLPALTTTPARLLGRSGELGILAPQAVGGYAVMPSDLEERLDRRHA